MLSKLRYIKEILQAPKMIVNMGTSPEALTYYNICNKPHPTLKVVKNKKYLVALMTKEEYNRQAYDINKCIKRGYQLRMFLPNYHLSDIQDIYESTPCRQGRAMVAFYREGWSKKGICMGVFLNNRLVAFSHTMRMGDMTVLSSILGHADHLKHGVMFLLFDGIVQELKTKWLMYDTFLGASLGLKHFKEKLGFKAYNIKWLQ